MDSAMLEASRVSVTTAGKARLSDISVTIKAGEITALIGPNGAGKTTLLQCLAASLLPSQGEISLEGRAITKWDPFDLARKRAVLPQRSVLNFPFPAMEVVLMGRTPHWASVADNRQDQDIAKQAMQAADCLHLQHRPYTRLSGGEQQRVQIARVIAQVWSCSRENPACLLLDEPVSALDLAHQFSLLDFLQEFASQGAAILLVMHDLNLVRRYADQLWVLESGKMVATGASSDILDAELIERVFRVPADKVMWVAK